MRGADRDRHERGSRCGGRESHERRTWRTRTVKSCGPGAPVLALSFAEAELSQMTVAKSRSPGRARSKPKSHSRRESRNASAGPVCSCALPLHKLAHETAGAARTRLDRKSVV